MTTFDDDFYRDILEGIAVHSGNPFYRDILDTLTRHQSPELGVALNKNQMASKRWLADALFDAGGAELGRVLILGGWVGALGAVLLHDRRFSIDSIVSIDIDPRCAPIALSLNATHVKSGRFDAATIDMLDIDYETPLGAPAPADLVINTSCEHLPRFDRWYARIPQGQRLVMQSNDYFAVAGHVNCAPDLATFRRQAPLATLQFAGQKQMRRYIRFMQIGFK
ncbi:MAG TPA: class I SAM-dependent methyltransferase [Casimicrobiaceae bacterium]|jgi:hypothetical protein|nr:class I SAM-dependent methyltransferase [Casimicrobiaceae bacterium]